MIFIIAEVGSTTNGSFDLATEMILEASRVGADAVKFQALETSVYNSWAPRLKEIASTAGVELMVTPFDPKAVDAWDPYVDRWKIASAELVNEELIRCAASTGKSLIISTGMASHDEAARALEWTDRSIVTFEERPARYVRGVDLLHCVSSYPASYDSVNLQVLRDSLYSGLSDHTVGAHVPIAAAALGARIIEKHIKPIGVNFSRASVPVDRSHPDHGAFAVYPPEFAYMVRCIRDVERALGDGVKRPTPGEAYEARGRRLESV